MGPLSWIQFGLLVAFSPRSPCHDLPSPRHRSQGNFFTTLSSDGPTTRYCDCDAKFCMIFISPQEGRSGLSSRSLSGIGTICSDRPLFVVVTSGTLGKETDAYMGGAQKLFPASVLDKGDHNSKNARSIGDPNPTLSGVKGYRDSLIQTLLLSTSTTSTTSSIHWLLHTNLCRGQIFQR